MSRDQRLDDNWALLFAQQKAKEYHTPLLICFCLTEFLNAPLRHYVFMIDGLAELAQRSHALGIPFFLLQGDPSQEIPDFIEAKAIGALVTDFSPLRLARQWKAAVVEKVTIPVVEVDAHNIVPAWLASPKAEFAAYTFRPKITKLLPQYLEEFSAIEKGEYQAEFPQIDWSSVTANLKCDQTVGPVEWIKSGEAAAQGALEQFIAEHLIDYDQKRNDPTQDGQSNLSPYLHFGQLSAQRIALDVEHAQRQDSTLHVSVAVFLEELIVRRELSDNFCLYTPEYDQAAAWPNWAVQTHQMHRHDLREHLYTLEELEHAHTHDPAWNAAQTEMVKRGKMHGYMRMYWAKKILEWTSSPEEALQITIFLNDKYFLDGRDPNGYVGIQWSIAGVHDRSWFERPVFGTIRYMNFNGLKRKFKIDTYVDQWSSSLGLISPQPSQSLNNAS